VARFDHGNALRRPAVAMPGDGNAVQPVLRDERQIMLFGFLGERAGGLAGGKHHQPAAWRRVWQMRRQAARGMRGGDRGPKQRFQQFARFGRHAAPQLASEVLKLMRRRGMERPPPALYLSIAKAKWF